MGEVFLKLAVQDRHPMRDFDGQRLRSGVIRQ